MKDEELFHQALDQPSEQRGAFLDARCGHDLDQRARIEGLLSAHGEPGSFLQSPADAAFAQTIAQRPLTEGPGMAIGPYKLLEQIGEGGMGVVYMAEQAEPVRRRVALKVIKPGMDTRQVIVRFEAERQALAMMDHPNIAKVLAAGTTDAGRPYFVMELVHGVPLTHYCDEHHLTPRQRLELFLPICQSIQHAHQKGIIHRDIKPTNILVAEYDQKAVPKVIDFGVAKAIGSPLTEKTMFTGFGQIVGTIEYMSPEQAKVNQLDIDTRSDIYSLGVLLYELLAGSTPFDKSRLRSASFDEMLRIIREEEPPRMSTRLSSSDTLANTATNRNTEPKKLSLLMRGELDWIVMKAIEKDRGRRYETATSFANDIHNYLTGAAVQAVPPSAGYRLRKFARRNTRALASTALLSFAILVVAAILGWSIRDRAAYAQKEAEERAERHAAIDREVSLALSEAEQFQKQSKWSEALSAAKRAQGLLASGGSEASRDRAREIREDLEMILRLEENRAQQWHEYAFDHAGRSRAYARVFTEFGIDVEHLSPAETAALIVRRPTTTVRVAAALDEWAQILRDWGFHDPTRDPAEWKRLLEAARLADPDPWRSQLRQFMGQEDLEALRKLADESDMAALPVQSLLLMGSALIIGGDRDAAIAWLLKSHQQHPDDASISFDLAFHLAFSPSPQWTESLRFAEAALAAQPSPYMYDFVGIALSSLGRHDEAITAYHKAIELKPDYLSAHINLGNSLRALAVVYHSTGRSAEADALAQRRIDFTRRLVDQFPANRQYSALLADAYYRRGFELMVEGRISETAEPFQSALMLWDVLAEESPGAVDYRYDFARGCAALAGLQKQGTASDAARQTFEEAFRRFESVAASSTGHPDRCLDVAFAYVRLGHLTSIDPEWHAETARLDSALMSLLNVMETDESLSITQRETIGHRLRQWGCPLLDANVHLACAERALGEAVQVFEGLTSEAPERADNWHYLADTRRRLGRLLELTNRSVEAESAYRAATAVHGLRAAEFPDHPEFLDEWSLSHFDLGRFLMIQPERQDAAILSLTEATRLNSNNLGYWRELGIALYRSQRWGEAVVALEKPVELGSPIGDSELFLLAMSWWHLGELNKARTWFDEGDRRSAERRDDETLQFSRNEAAHLLGLEDLTRISP